MEREIDAARGRWVAACVVTIVWECRSMLDRVKHLMA